MRDIYKAFDGKIFEDEADCLHHEKMEMLEKFSAIQDFCIDITDCQRCPFGGNDDEHSCLIEKTIGTKPINWDNLFDEYTD